MPRFKISACALTIALACSAAHSEPRAVDTRKAEHRGNVTGYAYHGISYALHGSGVGGATWGMGSGVVGNKRGETPGNGVIGTRLEGGDGNGVAGNLAGTGSGNGVRGDNTSPAPGAGGAFSRTDGKGPAVYAIKGGTGDGDALLSEMTSTGAGHAVTAVRKVGASTKSIGYLGYYDPATEESYGVYGAAIDGKQRLAGRFDGDVRVSGGLGVNGAAPQPKPTIRGSRGKNEAIKNLLAQLAAYGLIVDATTE